MKSRPHNPCSNSGWLRLAMAFAVVACVSTGESPTEPTPEGHNATFSDVNVLSVVTGKWHTCALLPSGEASCWGLDFAQAPTPDENFTQLAAGAGYTCGLNTSGAIVCWDPTPGQDESIHVHTGKEPYAAVEVGATRYACGLYTSGHYECWEVRSEDIETTVGVPPESETIQLLRLALGNQHSCGVLESGLLDSWGPDHIIDVPEGTFTDVGAGEDYCCALRTSGEIVCWGGGDWQAIVHEKTITRPGPYQQLSSGGFHTCGLLDTGEIDCWGSNFLGQSKAPPGPFQSISAGTWHTCGILEDGRFACWGDNSVGQTAGLDD